MSTIDRESPNPAGGRWNWRKWLPTTVDEWLELREMAIELRPTGIDPLRFADWLLAELRNEEPTTTHKDTLRRYRRLLWELRNPPPKPRRGGGGRSGAGGAAAKPSRKRELVDATASSKTWPATAGNPRDERYVKLSLGGDAELELADAA